MNDTLKAAGRIGAELGAAKAENDRLRGLLEAALYYVPSNKAELRTLIDAALFHQAEPVEPAPAQDERELPDHLNEAIDNLVHDNYERSWAGSRNRQADADLIRAALAAPIAQTAPLEDKERAELQRYRSGVAKGLLVALKPQTAPQPEQSGLVEAAQGALAEIQAALEDAYLNAYPECCGQAHLECCGSPVQAWSEADQKVMDRFAQHERALRAALSAQRGDA